MTNRERFQRAMRFEPVDRMPMLEWAMWWDQTVDNWRAQGLAVEPMPPLPEGEALQVQLGLDLHMQLWVDFITAETPKPAHYGAPIATSMADYERILPTLYPPNPFDPNRLRACAEFQRRGEAIVWATLIGPFWGPRQLLGIEPHLYAFYDEPELMHRINADLADYNLRVLDRLCQTVVPDFITFAEDMSYNNGPMISEQLFDEFLLPYYRRMVPEIKARGVRVIVDSDGDITRALPWFRRAGVEGILPLERQAGVDVVALREQYPDFLFIGHFDKMCMPRGEVAMRAEFERLLPAMRQGGFIASVDHQTPPGVTFDQYRAYLKLYREYAERAAKPI